ncbi:hypothetical protein IMZ31_19670 (plasmid) [Pontibacillus sp. ALD_SL1]|uniref:hypothetical protein n=1 Tax=Pontibacillus sp. ALD_SL1 TaxID=2777185 RepID=UPI001A9773B8|nr:hypothetical protein [Pontibacillus sp. ALD_SL1]QST02771.1 hypothetical protein IMZ31_19670 [Pontibacillus sp. ALD_SL1]
MANIETLKERVAKAEEKVEKKKRTIERHKKQLCKKQEKLIRKGIDLERLEDYKWDENGAGSIHYGDICDVERKASDIKGAERKLSEAMNILKNWQEKLQKEESQETFVSQQAPEVIVTFLAQWKELAHKWHINRYENYQEYKKQLDEEAEEAERQYNKENGISYGNWHNHKRETYLKELGLDWRTVKRKKAHFAGGTVQKMDQFYSEKERLKYLEGVLEEERRAKLLDLIHRIQHVTGTILDASELSISEAGNLNGIIIGEKAKAKVETIGAGGYNIQVFHFRTLVHNIKERS